MGKISKYSNLYDKDGKLIRSVDSVSGRLDDYTIEELENLVDELAKDETIGDIIGTGYTPNIDPDKEEHNLPETEKYFQRWTKSNN